MADKTMAEAFETAIKWNLVPLLLGVILILLGGNVDLWKVSSTHVQGTGQYVILGAGIVLTAVGLTTNVIDQFRRKDKGFDPIDVEQIGVEVDSPLRDGESISTVPVLISGRFKKWPDGHKLWLFSERGDVFFPHKPLTKETSERWSASYWTDNPTPRKRTLYVYAVGKGGQAQIEVYFRCCETIQRLSSTEQWPGLVNLGPDFQICAERVVYYDPVGV